MAEPSIVAFGRYLRLIRERRKLSLEDVAHLTKAYPEPVNKGYLSRVERGQNHVGFSKMVALSRAYGISMDAFAEKYALDLEVERLRDDPKTEGVGFADLVEAGKKAMEQGKRLHAYAFVRDALALAERDALHPSYSDHAEQVAAAALGHGVYAVSLGRLRLGEVEVRASLDSSALRDEYKVIVWHELSIIHRAWGNLRLAAEHADRAIAEASKSPSQKYLGDAYVVRALVASAEGDLDNKLRLYQSAYKAYRESGNLQNCALALMNLASLYVDLGRFGASRRAIEAATRIERKLGISRCSARLEIVSGELAMKEAKPELALSHWHEAVRLAKSQNDRIAQFKAEFLLFQHAVETKNETVLNALGRRLSRLAPWIPNSEPEVEAFASLYAKNRKPKQRGVARSQHGPR